MQRRDRPDPATYVGKGKAAELAEMAESLDLDVVIFDDELSPAQQRNLEKLFKVDVVDRVALILDIFAQHAASQEGMVQVELAQLRYRLPRLRGRGIELSQQGGGIGTRGPGETQLEVDRRRIQTKITKLERDLVQLARTRATQRKSRNRRSLTTVALVGYTNAGKSTLLNRLTDADGARRGPPVLHAGPEHPPAAAPRAARWCCSRTRSGSSAACRTSWSSRSARRSKRSRARICSCTSSTPGTIPSRRPRSTRCARCSARSVPPQVPEQLVFTKTDVADPGGRRSPGRTASRDSLAVSAGPARASPSCSDRSSATGCARWNVIELRVPYDRGDVLAGLHRDGEVLVEVHEEGGTRVRARLPQTVTGRYVDFVAPVPG